MYTIFIIGRFADTNEDITTFQNASPALDTQSIQRGEQERIIYYYGLHQKLRHTLG